MSPQSLCTAVVQVFGTDGPHHNSWRRRHCGVATFTKDNVRRSYFIQVRVCVCVCVCVSVCVCVCCLLNDVIDVLFHLVFFIYSFYFMFNYLLFFL